MRTPANRVGLLSRSLSVFLCGLCGAVACSSHPEQAVADLQFLHEPITSLNEEAGGGASLGFGPSARSFLTDPEVSPDAPAMLEFARRARTAGKPVHATIWVRDHVSKRVLLEPGGNTMPAPYVVVRLADDPDPRRPR